MGFALRDGTTKSCGCYSRFTSENRTIHGRTNTAEYSSWQNMKDRCYNKNRRKFKNHGGRGIIVCDRWRDSFENFFTDMGVKPSPQHSLERIDNDGPYSPENCKWATKLEQNSNKRDQHWIVFNGVRLTLMRAVTRYGNVCYKTAEQRLARGWPVEQALKVPPNGVARGTFVSRQQ